MYNDAGRDPTQNEAMTSLKDFIRSIGVGKVKKLLRQYDKEETGALSAEHFRLLLKVS